MSVDLNSLAVPDAVKDALAKAAQSLQDAQSKKADSDAKTKALQDAQAAAETALQALAAAKAALDSDNANLTAACAAGFKLPS